MAIFTYSCETCGAFDLSRKIADRDSDAVCPTCGGPTIRLVSAPRLNIMAPGRRQAAIINERSGDTPRIIRSGSKRESTPDKRLHLHHHDHGNNGQTAKRPWQIGH